MAKRKLTPYGPGFARMKARLGPEAMEAMRQDVIARQIAAREAISGERIVVERNREWYRDYPKPKTSKRRK